MQDIIGFCQGVDECTFAAGAIVIAQGDTSHKLFVLIEGTVEVLKGDVQVYVTSEPGALFGEISVLLNIPHTASVRAISACRAYVIGEADAFLRSCPEMTYNLSRLLAQRLNSVTSYLADLKTQFEEHQDHLSLVDEVLETLLQHQDEGFVPGSDRYPDPNI